MLRNSVPFESSTPPKLALITAAPLEQQSAKMLAEMVSLRKEFPSRKIAAP